MDRVLHPKKFFNSEEEKKIIEAIQAAEKATSGEIRVHLTKEIKTDPLKEAIRIFKILKMDKTQQSNGCLVLIGLKNKKIVVIGDKGINDLVENNFWDDVINNMVKNFKKQCYVEGLVKSILMIGDKLKKFFPYTADDINELSDTISKENL
ncbi:MAG: TPM domain-containing protein [Candidatus Omnitrophica bacterium]|nr:TPM domain-containing protein [Candidatus Omnitrophota bacterium]MCK5393642.1 TPM domain-containing protein [Candidatus Omnitrophota bacterium]